MTNAPDTAEWAFIHTDADHVSVMADGDAEDVFGYKLTDCPLCQILRLADTRNVTAAHMIMTFDPSDTELADIIVPTYGPITDSAIDEILADLDGDDDI